MIHRVLLLLLLLLLCTDNVRTWWIQPFSICKAACTICLWKALSLRTPTIVDRLCGYMQPISIYVWWWSMQNPKPTSILWSTVQSLYYKQCSPRWAICVMLAGPMHACPPFSLLHKPWHLISFWASQTKQKTQCKTLLHVPQKLYCGQ